MQGCVSASRDSLGEAWLQSYLSAPIWRFWLGADICGSTVAGALMSSLDGVGRYYPLTILAQAPESHAIPPPDLDSQDQWFAAAEELLLSTLDKAVPFETITQTLSQFPAPGHSPLVTVSDGFSVLATGAAAGPLGDGTFSHLFESLRAANHAAIYSGASFWWTIGGENYQPFGFCCHLLPDPSVFDRMLTGPVIAR